MDGLARDEMVSMAKLAEEADRYDDMAKCMKMYIELSRSNLDDEERNLFSVAYKNKLGKKRDSRRILAAAAAYSEAGADEQKREKMQAIAAEYKGQVELEMKELIGEVMTLLEKLIETTNKFDHESQVFYYKMKGDYYRYEFECSSDEEKESVVAKSEEAYKEAMSIAEKELGVVDPLFLGLALNYSVFYYETKESPKEACQTAKQAFDKAVSQLDTLPRETYKDVTLILQLLQENLKQWESKTN